ncbi:hypothetical protein EBZ38_08495 [bacterium]|nr:hypothetical protein [bacterium]
MAAFKSYALKDIVESAGIAYKQNSISYIFKCPRCQKKDKLYIRKADGRFVCWVCAETSDFKGRAEFALTELTDIPISEIRKILYDGVIPVETHLNVQLGDFGEEDAGEYYVSLPWPLDYYPIEHPHSSRGLQYLQERGISLELAQKYGLRYCPTERRVVFPVEVGGVLLGWQNRTVLPTTMYNEDGQKISVPKSLTSKSLAKGKHLMFQDKLLGSDHAIICEGPIDAIKADLCGGNVATLGKMVSEEQIEIIKKSNVSKIYIALDRDAFVEAEKLKGAFAGKEMYRLLPAEGYGDLGDMTPEGVYSQFLRAERFDNSAKLYIFLK